MNTTAQELLHHWDCCEISRCITCGDLIRETADENERLRAWIQRTASDDNLKHRAGYHGRRVMLEAAAVLSGETIPKGNNP